MLDTNALSELIRNPGGTLARQLSARVPDRTCTSIVAACELRFGAQRKGSAQLTQRVEQLLQALTVLPAAGRAGPMPTSAPRWSAAAPPLAATTCSSRPTRARGA